MKKVKYLSIVVIAAVLIIYVLLANQNIDYAELYGSHKIRLYI